MTKGGFCICGKEIDEGELYCSDRCVFIASKMNTPLGQQMDSTDRAVRFFGKIYDKQQQALSQPTRKKHK